MATFPSGIFSQATISPSDTLSAGNHSTTHNNARDEIIAIETKVGVDGSAVANTLDWITNYGYRRETGTVAYASATTFTISGVDRTAIYVVGTRLRVNSATTPIYLTVVSSSFSTNTTVTVLESTVPNPTNTVDYEINPRGFETIPPSKIQQLAWTDYNVNWTATTNPSIGNGTISGKYMQIGKTFFVRILVSMGSTTTFGTGNWFFSTPSTVSSSTYYINVSPLGIALMEDAGTQLYSGIVMFFDTTKVIIRYQTVSSSVVVLGASNVSSTTPFTWGSGDKFGIQFIYEAA